jgi:acyl-CoA synthetase (AMP-forming)/AMP-acid ligase II
VSRAGTTESGAAPPAHLDSPNRGVIAGLEHHAHQRPDVVAVRERGDAGERSITWRALCADAARHRDRLLATPPTGAVMIASTTPSKLLGALLGGLWAGRPVLPVPPELPGPERASLARRAGVRTVMGSAAAFEGLPESVTETLELDSAEPGSKAGRGAPPAPDRAPQGAILLGSSGTTGLPKIVRRESAALAVVGENCRRVIGIGEADRMLLAIPLYHSYGIDLGVLTAMIAGCELELHDRFDPARVRDSLAKRGITLMPAVPLMLDALVQRASRSSAAPSLRRVFSAGSPLSRRIADAFRDTYGVPVGQIYGATEFGSVAFNDPDLPGYQPEQVGRPMPGVAIRILDAESPRIDHPLATGSEGQVAVASPSLLSNYVDSDEAPSESGFLLTGDLGRLDERGVLALSGRVKLLIDIGALKVNPLEIEAVLAGHPLVSEAIVVPLPYSETASRLKAVIVPVPGAELDAASLRGYAREHLIHYKVPRRFEITSDVPRTATGKILRQKLMPGTTKKGAG